MSGVSKCCTPTLCEGEGNRRGGFGEQDMGKANQRNHIYDHE